jgi:hypothetical protein
MTSLVVRLAAIGYSLLLIGFMATGQFTSARIGHMTWGQETDFRAIAVALSNIEYGLKNEIGYRRVSFELAKYLTSTGHDIQVHDEATRLLAHDPQLITYTIRAAASLPRAELRRMPLDSGAYVTTYHEDVTFADYYNIAFRLFGYNAYSTHYLYMAILILSYSLFVFSYWKHDIALATLLAAVGALFAESTSIFSPIFSDGLPSFAANRFLSTLGFIPMLHLWWAALANRPLSRMEWGIVVLQCIIMIFAIQCRTSGIWMVIAICLGLFGIIALRWWRHRAQGQSRVGELMNLRAAIGRPVLIGAIVLLGLSVVSAVRAVQLHPIYFSDDVIPHHMRWHSAWIGMPIHPRWSEHLPYPELANLVADTLSFRLFEIHMEKKEPDVSYRSSVTGSLYKIRMHERILRQEFFEFLPKNLKFMWELYSWYKPIAIANTHAALVKLITPVGWIFTIPLMIAAGWLMAKSMRLGRGELVWALSVTSLCSLLPAIWAYPAAFAFGDQFYTLLFLALVLGGIAISVVCRVTSGIGWNSRTAEANKY